MKIRLAVLSILCFRVLWKTVFVKEEYYFSDYGDIEKRTSILRELLGGIGENSVIGAGSVVTRPVPPNCVAVGNPCRVIRYFGTDRERRQHEV